MALTLRIENEPKLPDGGPVTITVTGRRSIDIGRDTHLDWTLPDPTRHISGKHCEVRYREGGYWLYDVSTNGTFLNGNDHRMQAPHRLRSGDRFVVGHYIIGAVVDGEDAVMPEAANLQPAPAAAPNYQELWANEGSVAPPIDRNQLKAPKELRAVKPDFLDWAADVPEAAPAAQPFEADPFQSPPPLQPNPFDSAMRAASSARNLSPDSWAEGPRTPGPPPAEAPPPLPTPRRRSAEARQETWDGPASAPDAPASETRERASPPTRSVPLPPGLGADLVARLAHGARVPPDYFANRDPAELAELMGQVVRLVAEGTMQLLNARQQAKRMARTASHTTIEALNNNPLKFSPTAEDALRILFGPATRSYLDAYSAFAQSFDDLKSHQVKTYVAMQHALQEMLRELDPEEIERESEGDRGIASLMGSRKARLWDAYVARWQAKAGTDNGGLVDAFMLKFAKFYDREGN